MIGTAVVALFTTFGSSLKALDRRDGRRASAATSSSRRTTSAAPASSPALTPAIAELPEVAATVGLGNVAADDRRSAPIDPTAGDPAAMASVLDLDVQQGSLADVGAGQIAVTDALRRRTTACASATTSP